MALESDVLREQEIAKRNLERSLSLERALFILEADLAEFESGRLREIPKRSGPAEGIYARLHELSRVYRELEPARPFLPARMDASGAKQWYEYGRRLAHTGSPAHAGEFLWKAFYGTLPALYRLAGPLVLYTWHSVFSFAGEKELRLDVAAELVPVLYAVQVNGRANRLSAQMMQLVAECSDQSLVAHAHGALSVMYGRLKNEKFARYHKEEQKRVQ